MERVRRAEVPSPRSYRPEISQELEGIVLKALSATPDGRYNSAGQMLEEMGMLMVREGMRANNHTLADFIQGVIEHSGKTKNNRWHAKRGAHTDICSGVGD